MAGIDRKLNHRGQKRARLRICGIRIGRQGQQVKPEHYQMFHLCALQDWPPCEVARVLRVSVAQAYLAKHRIERLLQEEMTRLQTDQCQVKFKPTTGS